ncbi:alpha/beta fold hydrolase [Ekhidna sp. To15]|uniref:alpha/beta fold hydrolase n=1 Tax=Ekhidna sp. To15 TaxID=3395267 RepID=UPI003F522AB3
MVTHIEVKGEDISRPAERPPKTNWKVELIKKGLGVLQHASSRKSAEIIWHYFTSPGRVRFTEAQKNILKTAETIQHNYRGDIIKSYRWGQEGPKVLLCHGWRSKASDFRRMINTLLEKGYRVEAIDMRAHGNSQGKQTALPEFRDIIKQHIAKNGPYEAIVSHSIGALATGIALSELGPALHPKNYFAISAPPYVRYFFGDIVREVGCNESVYHAMCGLVKEKYHQPIDYFDLRLKTNQMKKIDTHLFYCEDDQIVPFSKGEELEKAWPHASFVHVKGLGHYKIMANDSIISYMLNAMNK